MNLHAWHSTRHLLAFVLGVFAVSYTPLGAQAQLPAAKAKPWVVPRTPDGKPDLQGNWTNETQTPLERMGKQGLTLTNDEAKAIEDRAPSGGGVPRQAERSESADADQGRRQQGAYRTGAAFLY